MCEFCHADYNGPLWQQISFIAYLLPEKSTDNFKGCFCCYQATFSPYNSRMTGNGKLSVLRSTYSTDQINGSCFLKVTCPALEAIIFGSTRLASVIFHDRLSCLNRSCQQNISIRL
jgi:hypothetical protein